MELVKDFLGEFVSGVEGYLFKGLYQVYKFRVEIQCNWKIFMDGFVESYYGFYLYVGMFKVLFQFVQFDLLNFYIDVLVFDLKGLYWMFFFYGEFLKQMSYLLLIE